jgi:hypothetical protein
MTRGDIRRLLNENKDYGGYLNEEEFIDALFRLAQSEQNVVIYPEESE